MTELPVQIRDRSVERERMILTQVARRGVADARVLEAMRQVPREVFGNLDTGSEESVFAVMRKVNHQSGTTFLIVTHNLELARRCDRIIELIDGWRRRCRKAHELLMAAVASARP